MDAIDSFYQQFDSQRLLDEHGPQLRDEAREILAQAPAAKVAGMILMADSREAEPIRQALAAASGQPLPPALMVGTCPRNCVEVVLQQHVGTEPWQEAPGEPQHVLPVVVATRDGFRFGFFSLATAP